MPKTKRLASEYQSVPSAAAHFGVSRMTIYTWLATGKLTGENIDGRTFVVRDELYDTAAPSSNRPTRALMAERSEGHDSPTEAVTPQAGDTV